MYWAAAQLQPQRERLAQHCLTLNGYQTYLPRLREVRHSQRGGLIELPKPPPVRRGDVMRILRGPFEGKLAIYAGMKPRARVEVLLSLLGSSQRVMLAADAV